MAWTHGLQAGARWPLGAALLALALLGAACGRPTPVVSPTPSGTSATPVPATNSIYIQGGALRASDGSSRWSADLGADPPLMADGVAYVETTQGQDINVQPVVRAVRLADGTRAWQTALPAGVGIGAQVMTANGLLVLATGQFGSAQPGAAHPGAGLQEQLRLEALRTSDGSVAWQSAPLAVVRRPTVDTIVPFVSRLVVVGGRIVALADSLVTASPAEPAGTIAPIALAIAWNAADGSEAWRIPLPNASAYAGAGATLSTTGGTIVIGYAGAGGEQLGGVDVVSGAWVWSHGAGGAGLDLATPTALVLSDSDTGSVTALRPGDGTTLWTLSLTAGVDHFFQELAASVTTVFYRAYVTCPGAVTGQPQLLQDLACPQVSAVGLADGKLLWQRQLPLNPIYDATYSAYGAGALYYQYFYGSQQTGEHIVLLALDGASGGQRWSHETGALFETIAAGPGAVYGLIRVPNGACPAAVVAFRGSDGAQLWQRPYFPCPGGFVGGLARFPWIVVA